MSFLEKFGDPADDNVHEFHVLVLSGGGYRGLYIGTILSQLESLLGKPSANHFDLVCGTSAGGLLALGLAAEVRAEQLQALFEVQGNKIFGNRNLLRRLARFAFMAKHSDHGLRESLGEIFLTKTIGNLRRRVLIPTVNYATGMGQFFKTPHHPSLEPDHRVRLTDVGLATSAAPTYHPISRNPRGAYVDGGLVGNAPGLSGLHEVHQFITPEKD